MGSSLPMMAVVYLDQEVIGQGHLDDKDGQDNVQASSQHTLLFSITTTAHSQRQHPELISGFLMMSQGLLTQKYFICPSFQKIRLLCSYPKKGLKLGPKLLMLDLLLTPTPNSRSPRPRPRNLLDLDLLLSPPVSSAVSFASRIALRFVN